MLPRKKRKIYPSEIAYEKHPKRRLYYLWREIHKRCKNQHHKDFHRYGGRGISVCQRWHLFDNFYADMGLRPEGKSIDRIDNDGNYEPSNCRWADPTTQVRNRSMKRTG